MTVSSQTLNNTIDTHPRGILTRTCRRVRDDGKELRSTKIDAVRRTSAHPDLRPTVYTVGGFMESEQCPQRQTRANAHRRVWYTLRNLGHVQDPDNTKGLFVWYVSKFGPRSFFADDLDFATFELGTWNHEAVRT
jgi:hypothetical protein